MNHSKGDLSLGRLIYILLAVILIAGAFGGFLGASSAGLL